MVQIIVNEDENNNEKVISKIDEIEKKLNLVLDFVSGTDVLVTSISGRLGDMESILDVEYMRDILKNQSELLKKVDDLNKKFDEQNEVMKVEPAEVKKGGKRRKARDKDRYEPLDFSKELWAKLELLSDGSVINKGHKVYTLPVDVYDLLYVIECDNNGLTYGEFKELFNKYGSNNNTFGKLIYNIRKDNFKDILIKYYDSIKKVTFEFEDNCLVINGEKFNISKKTVNDWIHLMFNSNRKQKSILNIVSGNPDIEKSIIHLVCDNYDNSKLLDILKDDDEVFVENNPTKRENLIMNGGIV